MSPASSLTCVITASLITALIAFSSISSARKAAARIAFPISFVIPAISEIWWRHVASEAVVIGSPAGQSISRFSKNRLPSIAL